MRVSIESLLPRMLIAALALTPLLSGCPAADDDDADCAALTYVSLADEQNYSYSGELDIQTYTTCDVTRADGCDPLIDWSGLTLDLQGHELDPSADITFSSVVVFRYLTEEEIEQGLAENTLEQVDVALYVENNPTEGVTQAHLSDHTLFGNDIDVEQYYESSYGIWLFTINSGSTPGVGSRMPAFLYPDPTSDNELVTLTNDSTTLTVDATLTSVTPVQVAAGTPFTVNWGDLTTHGNGNPIDLGDIDQVMVGQYLDMTPADLEANLLDLELINDGMWTFDLPGGTEADLATLEAQEGAFPGVDDQGTWILALRCSTCANPAPPFLGILETCSDAE